jgi:hypothetical protein
VQEHARTCAQAHPEIMSELALDDGPDISAAADNAARGHAETGKEAELRVRLRQVRSELRSLEDRIGVLEPSPDPAGYLSVVDE